jgi:hypothetical protein
MPLGMAVYESGSTQGFVYFRIDSIVSLLYVLEDGASTEIAVTGHEGLVGISLFMGCRRSGVLPNPHKWSVPGIPHNDRRLDSKSCFRIAPRDLQHVLLRFTQGSYVLHTATINGTSTASRTRRCRTPTQPGHRRDHLSACIRGRQRPARTEKSCADRYESPAYHLGESLLARALVAAFGQ